MFYTKKTIDKRLQELQDRISTQIAQEIAAHELRKEAAELKLADERQQSDNPFVEIISDGYDPELGVQLQLDWNAAFIKELRAKGYTGSTEREIVNKWLITVHKQLATQFEQ